MGVWHKPYDGNPVSGVLVPIKLLLKDATHHDNDTVIVTNGYFDENEWVINIGSVFKSRIDVLNDLHMEMIEWCDTFEVDVNDGAAIKLVKYIQKMNYRDQFGEDDYFAEGYNKCLREIKNALVTYCNL